MLASTMPAKAEIVMFRGASNATTTIAKNKTSKPIRLIKDLVAIIESHMNIVSAELTRKVTVNVAALITLSGIIFKVTIE